MIGPYLGAVLSTAFVLYRMPAALPYFLSHRHASSCGKRKRASGPAKVGAAVLVSIYFFSYWFICISKYGASAIGLYYIFSYWFKISICWIGLYYIFIALDYIAH